MHVSMMPAIITVRSRFSITAPRSKSKVGTGIDEMGQIDLKPRTHKRFIVIDRWNYSLLLRKRCGSVD